MGATSGRGPFVKYTAQLLSAAASPTGSADWATDYVRASCKVLEPADPIEMIGVRLGVPAEQQVQEAISKMAEVHEALGLVADSRVELTLAHHCADACQLMHQLRARGPEVSSEVLQAADQTICDMLRRIVGGPVAASCNCRQAWQSRVAGWVSARLQHSPLQLMSPPGSMPGLVVELFALLPSAWGRVLACPGPSGQFRQAPLFCRRHSMPALRLRWKPCEAH